MNRNCIVAQSGGPTAAINASLAGVLYAAAKSSNIDTVYCGLNGIEGILNRRIIPMTDFIKADNDLELLKVTPASFLGSCRYKLGVSGGMADFDNIFRILEEYKIEYFFYIGGNDSMDTVYKLDKYAKGIGSSIKFMGIPKTIDNDLAETDHTPGFGSAAKYIASSVMEIAMDSRVYTKKAVTIVEIMGRNAGWLTAAASLARGSGMDAPHFIYLPETVFSIEQFVADIQSAFADGVNSVVVAISEGIRFADGKYVCDSSTGASDVFGNPILSGAGKVLENIVRNELGCKARSVEINVLQRCGGHVTSATDISESFSIGTAAVEYALAGESGRMMVFIRTGNSPYSVKTESRDIEKIALVEKTVPADFIKSTGNDVTGKMLEYIRPLIEGNTRLEYENGIPKYLHLPKC